MVKLDLAHVSRKRGDREVKAKYIFRVKTDSSEQVLCDGLYMKGKTLGKKPLISREEVLDLSKGYLLDGNLTIELDIQVYMEKTLWRPKTAMNFEMTKLLKSAKLPEAVNFQVGTEKFSAHRNILEARAPELAALTDDYPPSTVIPIHGIKPSTFRSFLNFVYDNVVPESEELLNEAPDLIDSANLFGCKGLKLLAEAELVELGITGDTAADLILLGDAKTCHCSRRQPAASLQQTQRR
jgi:hypothetical protein